ncbi:DUF3219 family protein [Metabacillus sp. 113a]|uniref:DUF3219 family protein n=1 Tax=Metabacillus sp. 113a TaxID=3404706 RepID=UPI003CFA3835
MEILINERRFEGTGFVHDRAGGLHQITFNFKVRSGQEYHEVTTLLYKNDFHIQVPEEGLSFQAVIQQYSTSAVNLYEENAIADYHIQLIEKKAGE